jgi:CheY-like chemotaxis protein
MDGAWPLSDLATGHTGEELPRSFVKLVRNALVHLYDPPKLLTHPLADFLSQHLSATADRAQVLRVFLLDAIDSLEPPAHALLTDKQRRPHAVLVDRYIGGLSLEDIAAKMHLSVRQVRREHEEGVRALAAFLWALGRGAVTPDATTGGSEETLESEVEALGVALEERPLADLLRSLSVPLSALGSGSGVRLTLEPLTAPCLCLYDPALARQAVLSCLSALCALRPQRLSVGLRQTPSGPSVEIEVTPPLSPEASAGLGQQLAACTGLMKAQGGNVSLLSGADGHCNRLQLWFRLRRGARLLVIDDNENMLALYARYLAMGNHEIDVAHSAAEAEAFLQKRTPDLIVLDVMMREVDGWEFLHRLRKQPHLDGVPVLVCSVLYEPELAAYLGAQACLKKPVIPEDLLQAVDRALQQSSPAPLPRA